MFLAAILLLFPMIHVIARGVQSGYIIRYASPGILESVDVEGQASEELNLSGSSIQEIKDNAFQNATRLKSLNLSENELLTLRRRTFAGLTNLENLDLSGNLLARTTTAFVHLSHLRHLNLSNNVLTSLTTDDLFGVPGSCTIRLKFNYISQINLELLSHNYHIIID